MEHEILQLLKQTLGAKYSYKEIGRIVNRRRYRDDSHWARPVVEQLVYEKTVQKEGTLYFIPRNDEECDTETMTRKGGGSPAYVKTYQLEVDPEETLARVMVPVDSLQGGA